MPQSEAHSDLSRCFWGRLREAYLADPLSWSEAGLSGPSTRSEADGGGRGAVISELCHNCSGVPGRIFHRTAVPSGCSRAAPPFGVRAAYRRGRAPRDDKGHA